MDLSVVTFQLSLGRTSESDEATVLTNTSSLGLDHLATLSGDFSAQFGRFVCAGDLSDDSSLLCILATHFSLAVWSSSFKVTLGEVGFCTVTFSSPSAHDSTLQSCLNSISAAMLLTALFGVEFDATLGVVGGLANLLSTP